MKSSTASHDPSRRVLKRKRGKCSRQNDVNSQPAGSPPLLDGTIARSMMPERLPTDKTFKTFVTNLLGDIELIKQLRELSKGAVSPGQRQEVDEVLSKVVTLTAETYGIVRAYLRDDTCLENLVNQDPADKIIEDLKTRIEFEQAWGSCIHELGEPIAVLKGCIDALPSLPDENRVVYLFRFDQALNMISAIVSAYENQF